MSAGEQDVRTVATTYFDAWRARDFERLRTVLADEVTFRGPLGTADGAEQCLQGLRGIGEFMTDLVVQTMAVDASNVVTWYDLHTSVTEQPLPTANWSRINDGRIVAVRAAFDPRPLLPPGAAQAG